MGDIFAAFAARKPVSAGMLRNRRMARQLRQHARSGALDPLDRARGLQAVPKSL
ncbi:hypothetical protein FHY25_003168 [Xanthomonas arboricola]|nr:hypothetical protein [Xanthomonas campestris]MCW2008491.1 hypothetical protein [Xanthomonas campestris]